MDMNWVEQSKGQQLCKLIFYSLLLYLVMQLPGQVGTNI